MNPTKFPQQNIVIGPPPGVSDADCISVPAFVGEAVGGAFDGARVVIVAWQPSLADIERMANGAPVFLMCLGGLPPHRLATEFEMARGGE